MKASAEKLNFEARPVNYNFTAGRRAEVLPPVQAVNYNAFSRVGAPEMTQVSLIPDMFKAAGDIATSGGLNYNYNPSSGPGIIEGVGSWIGWAYNGLADFLSMIARGIGIGASFVENNPKTTIGVGATAYAAHKAGIWDRLFGRR